MIAGLSAEHYVTHLWLLDMQSMAWSQPATCGTQPAPRAGAFKVWQSNDLTSSLHYRHLPLVR